MKDRDYSDIIDLPCPTSERHARMSRSARAAQFAPFDALTGYEDSIEEAARLTMRRIEPDEDMKESLDRWWNLLPCIADAEPEVSICYFVPDRRKGGGEYKTATGRLTKLMEQEMLLTVGGVEIPFGDIISIDSNLYRDMIERGGT
ncbi:MAG: hypothetical protein IJ459_04320 [Clostridia bacterium]|nr:hypothetical protein [Clostridia bacterium]